MPSHRSCTNGSSKARFNRPSPAALVAGTATDLRCLYNADRQRRLFYSSTVKSLFKAKLSWLGRKVRKSVFKLLRKFYFYFAQIIICKRQNIITGVYNNYYIIFNPSRRNILH